MSDVDRAVGTQYEATREPEHKYASFALRVAYLIDPDGVIQRAYDVTDVAGFADEVLADLEVLQDK